MTDTQTTDSVLLACDLAVRMTLEAAARSIRNRRGRGERARYAGVGDDILYLVLNPPPTAAEYDQFADTFTRWWGLPSVLDDADTPHIGMYMRAMHEYVRNLILTQTKHQVPALRAYLTQVDVVAAAG